MNRLAAAALSVFVCAAPAAGQLSAKQAESAFRASAKASRKLHAADLKLHLATLADTADVFLAEAEANGVPASFPGFFDAVVAFQVNVYFEFTLAQSAVATDGELLLGQFADGADLQGQYPEEFYFGTGRAFDDFMADLVAAQDKALDKARKLLTKVNARLEKLGAARLSFYLAPATIDGQMGFTQHFTLGQTRDPFVLHTVLGLGFADEPLGGVIGVAGLGADVADAITARIIGDGDVSSAATEFYEKGTPAWKVLFDDQGDGLADGNYAVMGFQGTYGATQSGYVSLK